MNQLTEQDIEDCIAMYASNVGLHTTAKSKNTTVYRLTQIFKSRGIHIRNHREAIGVWNYNEHAFDVIDTPDKAYAIGLLAADGTNTRKTVSLFLQKQDAYITLKIHALVCDNAEIRSKIAKWTYKGVVKQRLYYGFSWHNTTICEALEDTGIIHNKTQHLKMPSVDQVPKKYIWHFLRGFSDGDGCWSIFKRRKSKTNSCHWSALASESFIHSLQDLLKEHGIHSAIKDGRTLKRKSNSWGIVVQGNANVVKLANLIYKDCDGRLYLTRKKEKADKICEIFANSEHADNPYTKMTDDIKIKAFELFDKNWKTPNTEISKILNICAGYVTDLRRAYKELHPHESPRRSITYAIAEQIREDYKTGMYTYKGLAKKYNTSKEIIPHIIKRRYYNSQ